MKPSRQTPVKCQARTDLISAVALARCKSGRLSCSRFNGLQSSPQDGLRRNLTMVSPLPFGRGEGRGEGFPCVVYRVVRQPFVAGRFARRVVCLLAVCFL